jgi:hypothetical protein
MPKKKKTPSKEEKIEEKVKTFIPSEELEGKEFPSVSTEEGSKEK